MDNKYTRKEIKEEYLENILEGGTMLSVQCLQKDVISMLYNMFQTTY